MSDTPVLVVIEIVSVKDPAGMKSYTESASKLGPSFGGIMLGVGGKSVEGGAGFGTLAVERWASETAFRTYIESEAYQPLSKILHASADVRAAIIPMMPAHDA